MNYLLTLTFAAAILSSCRTASDKTPETLAPGADMPEYDGSAESMDALPDCSKDMAGSQFWVRETKTSYECGTDGQWGARGHLDPDATPSFGPRSISE